MEFTVGRPSYLELVLCLEKLYQGVSSALFLCLLFPFIDQSYVELVLCLEKLCQGVSSVLFLCLLFPFIDQTAKTKVINSCLNPVWNEELTFSMKEPLGVLKLEVFDRDRFKSDDRMGHAFLDLQPLVSASKLKRALKLTTGETTLRKVAPNSDNCLLADSFVTYTNGEIVLDVHLKLRDVECGELYVTVKWIDHQTTASE